MRTAQLIELGDLRLLCKRVDEDEMRAFVESLLYQKKSPVWRPVAGRVINALTRIAAFASRSVALKQKRPLLSLHIEQPQAVHLDKTNVPAVRTNGRETPGFVPTVKSKHLSIGGPTQI